MKKRKNHKSKKNNTSDNSREKRSISKGTKISIAVAILLAVGFGIPTLYLAMNPPLDQISNLLDEKIGLEESSLNESTYPDGEFGNRYTSLLAGFTVEKPNEKWDLISDMSSYREKQGRPTTSAFVDGVILARPEYATIVISVQKATTEEERSITIQQWFESAMASRTITEGSSFELIERYISPEGDYGSIKSVERFSNDELYHYETIRFYNNAFYGFHINSSDPSKIPKEIIDEIDFIFNSYKIIS